MGLFPSIPVRSFADSTLNFERHQALLTKWGLAPETGPVATKTELAAIQRNVAGLNGAWTSLEGVSAKLKAAAGFEKPEVRTEGGATRAFLKGVYEVITSEIAANTTLFTVPSAFRPKAEVAPGLTLFNGAAFSANRMTITTGGVGTVGLALPVGSVIYLDGTCNWNLT